MAHGKGAALLALALCAAQVAGASEPTCAAALEHVEGENQVEVNPPQVPHELAERPRLTALSR